MFPRPRRSTLFPYTTLFRSEVACKQKHFDDYARQAGVIARGFNHQLRVVPRHELPAEIGSSIYYGGMVDEVSAGRSEEHTSELQSHSDLVCRLLLEKKKRDN